MAETISQRSERIIKELTEKYPNKKVYDLSGVGLHFVCEVEPTEDHPEYDKAVEVIIRSKPHKHLRMRQIYTIIKGTLLMHLGSEDIVLNAGDTQVVEPGVVHWAESSDECWEILYSRPGWTPEDHITVE